MVVAEHTPDFDSNTCESFSELFSGTIEAGQFPEGTKVTQIEILDAKSAVLHIGTLRKDGQFVTSDKLDIRVQLGVKLEYR